jgi:hypothetical protein
LSGVAAIRYSCAVCEVRDWFANHGSVKCGFVGRQNNLRVVGAVFHGMRMVCALECRSAGASEIVVGMTQRLILVVCDCEVGQVKFGPASPKR